VIAAIGLLLTARQLKIQNRQHRLEWGKAYSVRFWAIDDELTMVNPASDPDRYTGVRSGTSSWERTSSMLPG
jgi:hypothetical protein